jgi:hypothetical protein
VIVDNTDCDNGDIFVHRKCLYKRHYEVYSVVISTFVHFFRENVLVHSEYFGVDGLSRNISFKFVTEASFFALINNNVSQSKGSLKHSGKISGKICHVVLQLLRIFSEKPFLNLACNSVKRNSDKLHIRLSHGGLWLLLFF